MDKTLEKEAMKKILTNSINKKADSFITKFYFIKSNNYKLKNR